MPRLEDYEGAGPPNVTLFFAAGVDRFNEPTTAERPDEVAARIVYRQRVLVGGTGQPTPTDATMVGGDRGTELPVGTLVYHGTLADYRAAPKDGATERTVLKVVVVAWAEDVKGGGRNVRREYGLQYHTGAVPDAGG